MRDTHYTTLTKYQYFIIISFLFLKVEISEDLSEFEKLFRLIIKINAPRDKFLVKDEGGRGRANE